MSAGAEGLDVEFLYSRLFERKWQVEEVSMRAVAYISGSKHKGQDFAKGSQDGTLFAT